MLRILVLTTILNSCAASAFAQPADTTTTAKPTPPKHSQPGPSRVYFGGTVGFSFGDYFRISLMPWVGYKIAPKLSLGAKVGYEYIEDKRYAEKVTSHNYGGSLFTRYRIHPRVYAHAEFAEISYKYNTSNFESDRQWVPFIWLGGGLLQPMGPRTSLIVEVLFDVLRDDNSPYEDWSPYISIGVGVGL
jgi:hypothetical protein